MRLRDIALFGSLALGVHVGAWSFTSGPNGASSAGEHGADNTTLMAATAAQVAMVSAWQRIPDATTAPPSALTSPAPDVAALPRPAVQMTQAAGLRMPEGTATLPAPQRPNPPALDTESAAPPVRMDASMRPKSRPDKREVFARATDPARAQPRKVAKGSGNARQAGTENQTALQSMTAAQVNALRAQWGASIYAKIRSNMRYPRGLAKDGTTRLALRVASNGKLQNLRLTRSSGNAEIDRAAMRAVNRAGRFPKAPKELNGSAHDFSLSLTFTR